MARYSDELEAWENQQTKLFVDAIGWQECDYHGGFNPHAFYDERDIEQMMLEWGIIDCPYCNCFTQ